MATLRDSLLSSSARRLPIRKRPDLTARRQHYLGRSYWIVKDPVGLNYYRFQEEEYAILNMLDGSISMDEIKDRFEDEFPPQKITLDELQQFLGMLHRSGLVIAAVGDQGKQLLKRRRERRRKELLGAAANILCVRFKGFDPERFLNWLYPYIRWFYSKTAVAIILLMMLSALTLVVVQFHVFRSRLPEFHQFFNLHNALWLSVVLGTVKVLHEMGHGMTCKHFGGECHEMGVMILVLTPCLYCNVSDSWMLPNKWHRAAIGAGGMYVELLLASIATFVWWVSEPGYLLNNICLNIMFVCSVSTVVFNANPLLRYDGYYILADLTEIPNLRQKATTILSRKMGEWFLGLEQPDDPFLPERNQMFFAVYSVAAAIYRWFVVFSILFFLYQVFKPYGLEVIGQIIGLFSLWGLLGMPLWQLGKFFYVPGRLEKVKKPRFYASMAGAVAIVAAIFFIPLPHHVMATLEIQPRSPELVYVNVPEGGKLLNVFVKEGQEVPQGKELARLQSRELELEIERLKEKQGGYEVQLQSILGSHAPEAHDQIPQLEDALAAVKKQLAEKETDKQRLRLVAGRAGTVMPPPMTPKPPHDDPDGQLGTWWGTPLDERNRGTFLREGVLFCQVGDPKQLEAILIVDQGDIEFVQEGQKVRIKLDSLPNDTFEGKIQAISLSDLKITPQRLTAKAGGELPSKADKATGVERPQNPSYQAQVPLDDNAGLLQLGFRGRAKIETRWLSVGARIWRFATHMFNFKL
jgi:putative peptide zinc metalloprotease protein